MNRPLPRTDRGISRSAARRAARRRSRADPGCALRRRRSPALRARRESGQVRSRSAGENRDDVRCAGRSRRHLRRQGTPGAAGAARAAAAQAHDRAGTLLRRRAPIRAPTRRCSTCCCRWRPASSISSGPSPAFRSRSERSILIFGLAFAVLFFGTVRVLSLVEGRIIEVMLGERMPRRPVYAERGKPVMARIKDMFADPRTWSTLLYMVLMLPLGIIYFTIAVTGTTLSLALMVAPIGLILRSLDIIDGGGIYIDGRCSCRRSSRCHSRSCSAYSCCSGCCISLAASGASRLRSPRTYWSSPRIETVCRCATARRKPA